MRAGFFAISALILLACGGGNGRAGGSSPQPPPQNPPAAPVLTVASDIKRLQFSWASVSGASSYRLFVNPDGASGFSQIGADHAATAISAAIDVAAHRHDWVNALYRLEACNVQGCTGSNGVSAMSAMLDAIGYVKASNTDEGDGFGFSLAVSDDGNTFAVGAPAEASAASGVNGDQADDSAEIAGAVYVFAKPGDVWLQQAYVKASNPDENDSFGYTLALSGDGNTLAVGAPNESSAATGVNGDQSDDSAARAGAVYVFVRSGSAWSQQAYVKASNTEAADEFGRSLTIDGDGNTLVVAAPAEESAATGVDGDQLDNSAAEAGAAYVFTRTGSSWTQQAYLKASNTDRFDAFGSSVAISADGDTLALGAPGESSAATGIDGDEADNSVRRAGSAYVFTRTGSVWSQQTYVKASNTGEEIDNFGFSLALSADGRTLAVGANGEDSASIGVNGMQADNSALESGAVYVFRNAGTSWSQEAYVKASNTAPSANFGWACGLSADGNTLAVAALAESGASTGVNGDQTGPTARLAGAVYVFARSGNTWLPQTYVKATNTSQEDLFGASLALSADGNTLVVGAGSEDSSATGIDGNQANEAAPTSGAVYVY